MLTPEYLQSVPDAMVELYARAEQDILADMARRLNGFDLFIPAAQYQLQVLEEMGALRSDILAELGRLTGKSQKKLAAIMMEAGIKTLAADEMLYKAAGLTASPAAASAAIQETLAAGFKKTNGLFTNLTKTTANTATKQFEKALDRAYMNITSGAFDPATAVKNALKELAKQGVGSIEYPSGHIDSIEVAVRRAVITGVNQTTMQMQAARADEAGVDLVETTAHAGARPSHAQWQGKIFSRSGKSRKYSGLVQSTGYGTGVGLGGWGCTHSFRPYIEGFPRAYPDALLKEYAGQERTYNGHKMTEYEALQQQREIERKIRRWKRESSAMDAAGLDNTQSVAKIRQWQAVQRDFIEQTGLRRDYFRERAGKQNLETPSKSDIIKTVNKAIKSTGAVPKNATVHFPALKIDTSTLTFDDVHINAQRSHNVTRAEAVSYIENAKVSATVWKGEYENFFSDEGTTYVNMRTKSIRTSYKKDEYTENINALMEVLSKYEK